MFILHAIRNNISPFAFAGLLYLSCSSFTMHAASEQLQEITDQNVISTLMEYPADGAHEIVKYPIDATGMLQWHLIPPRTAFLNSLAVKISDKKQSTYLKVPSQDLAKELVKEAIIENKQITWYIFTYK